MLSRSPRTAAAAVVLGMMMFQTSAAGAASASVQNACMSDYFAFCSHHDPDSKGVRHCMKASAKKLSKPCVNALIAAGEASPAKADK